MCESCRRPEEYCVCSERSTFLKSLGFASPKEFLVAVGVLFILSTLFQYACHPLGKDPMSTNEQAPDFTLTSRKNVCQIENCTHLTEKVETPIMLTVHMEADKTANIFVYLCEEHRVLLLVPPDCGMGTRVDPICDVCNKKHSNEIIPEPTL